MSVLEVERTPDWATWLHVPEVALWEGTALSLNIEPTKVKYDPDGRVFDSPLFDEQKEFHRRISLASRNLEREPALELASIRIGQPEHCQVSLTGFAAWACSIDWEVPPNFAEVGKRWTSPTEEPKAIRTAGNDRSAVTQSEYWQKLKNLAELAIERYPTWKQDQKKIQKSGNLQDWLVDEIGADSREAEIIKKVLSDLFKELQ